MLSKVLSLVISGILVASTGLGSQYVLAADKPAAKKEEKKATKKHKKAETSGKVSETPKEPKKK